VELNTVYVVFDWHAMLCARSIFVTMVGRDERGKFFLPFATVEKNTYQEGEMSPLSNVLVLPPAYRFKIVQLAKGSKSGEAPQRSIYFQFMRWMYTGMQNYGNDQLMISDKDRRGMSMETLDDPPGKLVHQSIRRTWNLQDVFQNRYYVSQHEKMDFFGQNGPYALIMPNDINIEVEAFAGANINEG
jgi:hypothetical protein